MTTDTGTEVREGTPFHASLTEAMYDAGRWERPGPPPPALEWTVWSPAWHHPRPLCIDGGEYRRRRQARRKRRQ
jgi:hypothetical protein